MDKKFIVEIANCRAKFKIRKYDTNKMKEQVS